MLYEDRVVVCRRRRAGRGAADRHGHPGDQHHDGDRAAAAVAAARVGHGPRSGPRVRDQAGAAQAHAAGLLRSHLQRR